MLHYHIQISGTGNYKRLSADVATNSASIITLKFPFIYWQLDFYTSLFPPISTIKFSFFFIGCWTSTLGGLQEFEVKTSAVLAQEGASVQVGASVKKLSYLSSF